VPGDFVAACGGDVLRTFSLIISRTRLCSSVIDGEKPDAVIVATGPQTYFGKVARSLAGQQVETASIRG
jgi:magnesium-transporting ATPase (P-type)